MISSEQISPQPPPSKPASKIRLAIALLLAGIGIWYVSRGVDWPALRSAFQHAELMPILAGTGVILATLIAKTVRWQLMFYPREETPPFRPTFDALMLGQFANNLPVRVGEFARVFALKQSANVNTAQALGTLFVEKMLDLVMLVGLFLLLLQGLVLPADVRNSATPIIIVTAFLLVGMYVVIFQSHTFFAIIERVTVPLPQTFRERLLRFFGDGLRGLDALRSAGRTTQLSILSAIIMLLSVMTPLVLFPAFQIEGGWWAAGLINLIVTLGITLPSTPARIGIFEGLTVAALSFLGIGSESQQLAYALMFHAVVLLPQLLLGGYAAIRSDWRWRRSE